MNRGLNFQILDCTIRDGGYLNDWHFDLKFVRELYRAHSKSGIDFLEIGFRTTNKYADPKKYGPWKFTPESILVEVTKGISGIPLSLMIDFGKMDVEEIPDRKDSLASMYRVAVHKDKVLPAIDVCNTIAEKGYIASIQLMGIVSYTNDDFEKIIPALKKSRITYVYFADSYGSLTPSDIKPIWNRLKVTGKKIGFHAHNNLQLAFANALEAIKCGVDIIDGSVYGIGRGAGNLPIEILLSYLEKKTNESKYNVLPVLDIIDRYMIDLHEELKWGYDLPYMLSGMLEVHPYYSKTLVDYREYSIDDILRALETVKEMKPIGFKQELLSHLTKSGFVGAKSSLKMPLSSAPETARKNIEKLGKPPYINRHRGQIFLILANGPSLKECKTKIDLFIERHNPVIIGANFLGGLFVPNYHVFSNRRRFIEYIDLVDPRSKILIASTLSKDFVRSYTEREFEFLHYLPQPEAEFHIENGVIIGNCRTVAILQIAAAIAMGAERVFIVGMDGYKQVDNFIKKSVHFYKEPQETKSFEILMEKHNDNERLLKQIDKYLTDKNKDGLLILTPTSHKAFYKSIDLFLEGVSECSK
jgi:4-hydroxy 2-oxovalerate aldolase